MYMFRPPTHTSGYLYTGVAPPPGGGGGTLSGIPDSTWTKLFPLLKVSISEINGIWPNHLFCFEYEIPHILSYNSSCNCHILIKLKLITVHTPKS